MVKTRKIQKIFVHGPEIIDKIANSCGCGRVTVYNALAYKTNSKMAQDIRSMALNRYGGVKDKQTVFVDT